MAGRNVDRLGFVFTVLLGSVCGSQYARAIDLQLHGFADLVTSMSGTEYLLDTISNHGSRLTLDPESNVGLNLSADLGEDLTFYTQFVGNGSDVGQYHVGVQWAFLAYRPFESLTIRAGRQITPVFMLSEQIDVGLTYLWTRVPYEVYGGYPLDAFYGISVAYLFQLAGLQLKTEIYGGGGDLIIPIIGQATLSGSVDNLKGIDISLSSDHFRVRVGYNESNPTATLTMSVPLSTTPVGTVSGTLVSGADLGSTQVFSTGGSFEYKKWVGITEFFRYIGTGSFARSQTGAYASLGYKILPQLTPYFMYSWLGALDGTSEIFSDPTISSTRKMDQHAEIAGVNFRMTPSTAFKLEYMRTQLNYMDSSFNYGVNTFTAGISVVF